MSDNYQEDGLPGIDTVVPVGLHQIWRERESGALLRTDRYNPPEASADPATAVGVEVVRVRVDDEGMEWPSPSTARTVAHAWLRTHCTYLPASEPPAVDDGGRLEHLRRALAELADHHYREGRRLRGAHHQAHRQGFHRGRRKR
ncbi:hypothetical protein RI138_32085 [Streptomyces sp. C11-1]|uniref:Uncharacterized protein n=1 Tax=Streptomyces durocortorensis TaxID=2811104 RepID=A0ABY9W5I8_9ACTN|nr:hypothetical protein [Streptomyces durocortorensis]WNF31095.1 hypothetical protein RI138_32085 [Streptomyces durocortorensis]